MKKTNVLILHGDQHRWDCLGCYGNPDVKTPNIDALAADGTQYTNHFTVYPVCTPSRYSMLCGMYTHQHNAWTNESTLASGTATFPRMLKQAGWHTAAVGKMHFTPTYLDVGFERMTLSEQNGEGRYEDDYHTWLKQQNRVDVIDLMDQTEYYRERATAEYYDTFGALESDLPVELHSTTWVTQNALREIEQWDQNGGNLLMAGYVKPHHPFDPPAPYSRMYDPNTLQIPAGYLPEIPTYDYENQPGFFDYRKLTEDKLRRIVAMYYGAITQIDDGIGEILFLLKQKGLYDDTMIIYTSDHGEYLGYHHMLLKGNYLYDPLARIPLIIKYPKGMHAPTVDDRVCENIDLATTILSACKIPPAATMCGLDLRANVLQDYAFSEGQYGEYMGYMLRSKRYKLLVQRSMNEAMFFDLQKDPCEVHNEINNPAYAEEIQQHSRELIQRVMFPQNSRNYVDLNAPQLKEEKELSDRAETVQCLIKEKMSEF